MFFLIVSIAFWWKDVLSWLVTEFPARRSILRLYLNKMLSAAVIYINMFAVNLLVCGIVSSVVFIIILSVMVEWPPS